MYFCVLDDVLHVVVYNSQVGLQNSPQTSFMPKERSERSGKDAFWTIIMIDAVLRLTVQVTARRERGAENPPKLQTGFKDWLRWCVSSGTCGFLHQIITLHPVSSHTRLCYEPNQKKKKSHTVHTSHASVIWHWQHKTPTQSGHKCTTMTTTLSLTHNSFSWQFLLDFFSCWKICLSVTTKKMYLLLKNAL